MGLREQVSRVVLASLLLTALLGLLAIGSGFASDLPPDQALWALPIGGSLIFAFEIVLTFSLIRGVIKRFWKPLELIGGEVPLPPPLETFPMKPWLILGFVAATAGFFAAASTSYFSQKEVDWGTALLP